MFELLEDRKRPEIKWWTIPGVFLIVFCSGIAAGILIGRRNVDPFEWLQVAFLILIAFAILSPISRELSRWAEERERANVD